MTVSVNPVVRVFSGGVPVSNAKINVYQTGTTTPVTTYSDGALSTPNTNPVITDVNGEAIIYVGTSTTLRYYITTSAGVLIKDIDPVYPSLPSFLDSSSSVAIYASGNKIIFKATDGLQLNSDQPILDSSGNEYIKFTKTASAVNEITIANAVTGGAPSISASGGDTNVDLLVQSKGAGALRFSTTATSTPFIFQTGTNYQHVTYFNFPNTSATRTITYPDNDINFTNGAFYAYQSSSQTISTNSTTKINLQSELYDVNSWFDSTTNFRYTPQVAGKYRISASFLGAYNSGGSLSSISISIYKNGISSARGTVIPTSISGSINVGTSVSTEVDMNGSTDYLEIYLTTVGTGNVTGNTTSDYIYFCGHHIPS